MAAWRCCNDNRINVRQSIFDISVCGDIVIDLRNSVIDLAEPLVYTDDRRYTRCGSQHANVPRSPVTYADNADSQAFWIRPHDLGA